jgi:hypothetical protein
VYVAVPGLTLTCRKFRRIVPAPRAWVLYVDHLPVHGAELYRLVCERDLEGIVAKHKDAPHGLEHSWLKINNPNYSQAEGRLELFASRIGKKPPLTEHGSASPSARANRDGRALR